MRRRTVTAILGATAAILAVTSYIVGDLYDFVPGILTTKPAISPADPPQIPGVSDQDDAQSAAIASLPQWSMTTGDPVDSRAIEAAWQPVLTAAADGEWKSWGYVVDAESGEVLLDSTGSQAHRPASVTKVLTAYVALNHLNPTDRLATKLLLEGDTVHLQGNGDLLLGAGESNSQSVAQHAGLGTLAREAVVGLQQRGVKSVRLTWSPMPFEGETKASAWDVTDVSAYGGHLSSLAINSGNLGEANFFTDTPAADAATVVADVFTEAGLTVDMVGEAVAPSAGQVLSEVQSATIGEQIQYMLQKSDNTLAEQYCHLAAKAAGAATTFAGAASNVVNTLTAQGVNTDGLVLDDCSGLSDGNRISGRTLVETIRTSLPAHAANASVTAPLLRGLPYAGGFGTLHDRMLNEVTLGNTQAKTGSLGNTSTLAGVVETTSGRLLIFAVGNDDVKENAAWATRPFLDRFIADIAAL